MTLNEVYDFLYDWINYVLNTRYSSSIQIIIGSQNAPKPAPTYIVIHEPPMSNKKMGDVQKSSFYKDEVEDKTYQDYSNTWRCSINIEEVGSDGSYLEKLMNTIEEDYIRDMWTKEHDITLEDFQSGSANNALTGNFIEKRYNAEIILLYTKIETIESEIVETIDTIEKTYTRGG